VSEGFERYTCTTTDVNRERIREVVLTHLRRDDPVRVMDVGCGTGLQIVELAESLPSATLIGVDISPPNIAEARRLAATSPGGSRVTFELGDYFSMALPQADAIVSDNTLHLVPGDTPVLFGKLAADLAPSGFLIVVMPYDCGFNRLLFVARRILRTVRSSLTDRVILAIGRLLHPSMSPDMLRERIHYMYRVPERIMTPALARMLGQRYGLVQIARYPYPHSSLAQPKHAVTVFNKQR
jgi:SAM-dependent methyltransferase